MSFMEITIGEKKIVRGGDPFIIAEAGINHNGSLDLAFKMIAAAKEAGADCVKFQTFKANEFVGDPGQMYTYISQGKEITESMLEMFRRYEFNREEWFLIKQKCDEVGILFLSTPQNTTDLELLLELGVESIKVGSDDFTNIPLLREYAKTGLPIIVSCGMSDLAEVYEALEAIGTFDGYPTILLLCTSQYPTPPVDVNLNRLKTLMNTFQELIIGFSDHTQGVLASVIAVGLGAVVFEKHFTLDRDQAGPDHWFSEDPNGIKKWVDSIRTGYEMLGSSIVRPTLIELANKKEFQRIIVASRHLSKGEIIDEKSITMRRMVFSNGLPPRLAHVLIGTHAHRDFMKGEPIIL